MPILESLAFTGSNTAAAFVTATGVGTDTGTIRNFSPGTRASILQTWGQAISPAEYQILGPELHDVQSGSLRGQFRGIGGTTGLTLSGSAGIISSVSDFLLPYEFEQPVNAQQNLTIKVKGNTAPAPTGTVDVALGVGALVYYDNVPGLGMRLTSPEDVKSKLVNLLGATVLTASGLQYSTTSTALNAGGGFPSFRNNTDYAILGYTTDIDCLSVNIKGSATSNIHVGGPGLSWNPGLTKNLFVTLSRIYGRPLIPVFNSADAASTFLEIANSTGGAIQPQISLNLAQLGSAANA